MKSKPYVFKLEEMTKYCKSVKYNDKLILKQRETCNTPLPKQKSNFTDDNNTKDTKNQSQDN